VSRADRKRRRVWLGQRRTVHDRKLILASLRAGICPCGNPEIEEPGEHLATCPWSDPDYPVEAVF